MNIQRILSTKMKNAKTLTFLFKQNDSNTI